MEIILPGIIDTVFRALSTRNVRKPAKFPTSMPMVAYPDVMTMKSSQFHGFRKYVYLFSINPLDIVLITISAVYIAKNMYLEKHEFKKNIYYFLYKKSIILFNCYHNII